RGTANFSIRGLGINSSIPGIDPTVGLFINGVYIGNNVGVVFDSFDLESIEVLRGPQGILFGRNVTGGAILMNTRTPGDEFNATFKAAADTGEDGGWNRYLMGAVGGPVTDTFGARLTLYYNDDQGWFENDFNGQNVGKVEQIVARPTLSWTPTDTLDLIMRYERSDIEGDGPVAQSHRNGSGVEPLQFEPNGFSIPDRNSFDIAYDEVGFQDTESDFLTLQADQAVDLGDGTITAIFGWRQSEGESLGDIDGQPVWLFHAPSALETEQSSFEMRYTGTFDERATFTAGIYYFENEINYDENREFAGVLFGGAMPFATFHGGGNLDVETYGAFTALDYDLNDSLTLNVGIRFSYEEKQAEVATLPPSQDMPCSVIGGTCNLDFADKADWDSFAPKLGATYHISDDARIYAHWTRGFRSGGYNMRNTSLDPADTPGPFDEEQVDNYEIGYKSTFGRGKLNAAVFYNEVSDMQRELNKPGPIGVIQLIQNTADAEILGVEVDATYAILDNLLAYASVGYIDAEYSEVAIDLNEDGVVDSVDKGLDLPRAPELTYSIGFSFDLDVGDWGYASSRVNYAYRDETAYTDSNAGFILEQEIVDAGIDLRSNDGQWTFSIYGKNLLDEVKHGGDTQLPADLRGVVPWGGTFSPLSKGCHYGAEVQYNF
ncbi:MAG: TonB-dependent receptor, partial [Halioglobus sp.]|nr:TonB-dependent receptor [Halioglobus sp.]